MKICQKSEPNFAELTKEEVFEQFFKSYYSRLVYFAYQILADKSKAEDIVQEAFIKFWDHKEEVTMNPVAIKNFLYSTVKNSSLNIVRHEKVVEKYKSNFTPAEVEETTVVNYIIQSEVLAEIHQAIQTLPESCQRISRMGYLEGMKNHEIAATLGISINTVKTQKQRAMQLLRLRLNPETFALLLVLFDYPFC
ncbi:RNA polymerase sigma-70 factor [Adhaeribacter radiodurans]|uniref:RNA polymerase sigma-70 factor n=1 Tax=Adhaeribacter radiodurans TaxID=2745197 RepID=A0A7L7LDJ2_9BACT|nr:RNA polymerase sigma-70 factor [Adhaeribacter radiodurans]QMU30890.1 RNA polymerase sigma-70 factor [Adhaeribacter radiodurans]